MRLKLSYIPSYPIFVAFAGRLTYRAPLAHICSWQSECPLAILPTPKRGTRPLSYPDDISPVSRQLMDRHHRLPLWHDRGAGASARLLPDLWGAGYGEWAFR